MSTRTPFRAGLALAALAVAGSAYIHPSAPDVAEDLDKSTADLHEYMHDNYPIGLGSHHLDVVSGQLENALDLWRFGIGSECTAQIYLGQTHHAYDHLTHQFHMNGVFNDPGAVAIYDIVTMQLHEVTHLMAYACIKPLAVSKPLKPRL